ncbi:MAG: hypothetical protein ABGF52_10160 [Candidatus Asgardarchaeum sp.]
MADRKRKINIEKKIVLCVIILNLLVVGTVLLYEYTYKVFVLRNVLLTSSFLQFILFLVLYFVTPSESTERDLIKVGRYVLLHKYYRKYLREQAKPRELPTRILRVKELNGLLALIFLFISILIHIFF